MTARWITIYRLSGKALKVRPLYVRGVWALTRSIEPAEPRGTFRITHIPSGRRLMSACTTNVVAGRELVDTFYAIAPRWRSKALMNATREYQRVPKSKTTDALKKAAEDWHVMWRRDYSPEASHA